MTPIGDNEIVQKKTEQARRATETITSRILMTKVTSLFMTKATIPLKENMTHISIL